MDITPRKRAKVVALGKHAAMTVRQIGDALDIGKSTVARIINENIKTGHCNTKRRGKCGRKRKTTARDDSFVIRNSVIDPKKTSVDLQSDLASAGVVVHDSTIRRRLLEVGRRAHKPLKKQLLTAVMMKKRLKWAKDHKNWSIEMWRKVIFSDESHFEVHGHRSMFVRRAKGEPIRAGHIQQATKHPPKKMFWGTFSAFGPGRLVPVEGMMNSDKYKNILETHLLPILQTNFPNGDGIFQQDLAPCHTSKKMQKFFEQSAITVLEWPGNSPDLNPIENLWAIVKSRLRKRDCSTMVKLINAVIQVWFHDENFKNMCPKIVDSMPNRVKLVIEAKGGHISY